MAPLQNLIAWTVTRNKLVDEKRGFFLLISIYTNSRKWFLWFNRNIYIYWNVQLNIWHSTNYTIVYSGISELSVGLNKFYWLNRWKSSYNLRVPLRWTWHSVLPPTLLSPPPRFPGVIEWFGKQSILVG